MISCKNQIKLFCIFIDLERKWPFIDLMRFFGHKRVFSQLSYIAELSIFIVLEHKWPFIGLMR